MASTKETARIAAKEDALPTGGAKIPDTEPVRTRRTLTPQEREANAKAILDSHIAGINRRVELAVKQLNGGPSSLAQYLLRYTDLPFAIRLAALETIKKAVATCEASLESSRTKTATGSGFDARSLMAQQP